MNHIVLIGRLTRDPEMKYTNSGVALVRFSLAVDRRFKNAQGERETDFINLVAWRKTAELINQYVKKGEQIAVQGSLQMRKYQTQQGENRTVYEVVVDDMRFLGSRGGSSGGPMESPPPPGDDEAPPPAFDSGGPEDEKDDDLPF
ncbi:MAG TPA: single-stranded DNA-binding protein [bacterium]|nr:single-stranded DNA-binding protein [bacterium]HPO10675.1 single-stranded DNA-binding protein [bacterium]HQO34297.1 single-stranded DNA-binding protein [bacterium]HQP99376.1 single-stranded DNA-binding protein [bacterium]